MMNVVRHRVAVTTDSSGDAEVLTPVTTGRVLQVHYAPDATAALDTNADLDITCDTSGVVIANHDNIGTSAFTKAYRQVTHGDDGAGLVYADAGEPVADFVYVAGEKIKLVIANGGDTKSGVFFIYVG